MKLRMASCRPRTGLPTTYDLVTLLCRTHNLPEPVLEFAFAPNRRFRADYCWPEAMVILEKQGGIWRPKGAHNTGTALLRDYEKSNLAQLLGYVYLQATPEQIRNGSVLEMLKEALC